MKEILNHPLYCVTEDGRVWAKPRGTYIKDKIGRNIFHGHGGKWLRPGLNCKGYLSVNLYDKIGSNIHKNYLVHQLILETFVGPRPDGMECCHNNGIRTDNRLENLRWGTRSENQQDSIKHGTHGGLGIYGEKHHNSKISNQNRRLILYMYATKLFTRRQLAKMYNVVEVTIKKLVEGHTFPYYNVTKLRTK